MTSVKRDLGMRALKVLNAVMLTAPFAICWYSYYAPRTDAPFYNKGNWAVLALFLAIYALYGKVYDAFLISMNRPAEIIYSQSLAVAITDGIFYVVIYLLTKRLPNPLPLIQVFICQFFLAMIWTGAARWWYFTFHPPKRSAVIYDKRPGLEALVREYGLGKNFDIQITAEVENCLDNLEMLSDMEVVFLSGVHSHERNIILKWCINKGIEIYVIPRIGDTIMSGARQMHMLHLPILNVGWHNPPTEYLILKRVIDVVIAGIALVLASPIMILTAIAIWATDRGPVFYRQKRLTRNGQEFFVLKFRSMRVDAEKDGVARLSTGDKDDRITPVGRIIRKCRIDELPQLFNILAGSMSLVGPRPERPEIAEQYMKELPEFALRLKGKAGLTGYAQVYGKYNTEPYDKLQMDLMYLAHPSIVEDLRIMFSTVKILFLPESTEGVAAGQTTAAGKATAAGQTAAAEQMTATRQPTATEQMTAARQPAAVEIMQTTERQGQINT